MNERIEIEKMQEIPDATTVDQGLPQKGNESESKCKVSPAIDKSGEKPLSLQHNDSEEKAVIERESSEHSTVCDAGKTPTAISMLRIPHPPGDSDSSKKGGTPVFKENLETESPSPSTSTDEPLSSRPLVIQHPIIDKESETTVFTGVSSSTFREKISSMRLPNAMQHRVYQHDFSIEGLTEDIAHIQILDVGLEPLSTGLNAELLEKSISVHGTPTGKGTVTLWIEYTMGTPNDNSKKLKAHFPELTIFPDPKALWKDLPVDESAPYQTPNEAVGGRFDINGKNLVIASKRGRSHAHEGKFRDDSFSFGWIPEYQWLIVAVSDGAGSAEFSRKGAEIACLTFVDELKEKLSTPETNYKIDSLDKHNQEMALERLLFSVAHQAAVNIKDVANEHNDPIKKYSATFLGYIAKKFENEWLFVSVGIGDGAIALLDTESRIHLLNEPDGGEYVGQTRFLTTPEVWKDNHKRTSSIRVRDFQCVFSMTDGVSDPMFETDNNLKDSQKWIDFWNNLKSSKDNPIHFDKHEEQTQKELLAWLDFWSKGNHDDRTLAVLY